MHIRQGRSGIQDVFLKCQIDCREHYRNGFPKKVARGLDTDREVKAIFLAGKQSIAVESSKIWQHALCASTKRLFLGERIFSRNASRASRRSLTNNNTISIPFRRYCFVNDYGFVFAIDRTRLGATYGSSF